MFLPDPNDPESGLPSPGRGAHLEVKVVIGEGAGHGVWKRIEGERQSAEARRKEGEMLRQLPNQRKPVELTFSGVRTVSSEQ